MRNKKLFYFLNSLPLLVLLLGFLFNTAYRLLGLVPEGDHVPNPIIFISMIFPIFVASIIAFFINVVAIIKGLNLKNNSEFAWPRYLIVFLLADVIFVTLPLLIILGVL